MKLYSKMRKGGEQQKVKHQSWTSKCGCTLGNIYILGLIGTIQPNMLGVNAVFYNKQTRCSRGCSTITFVTD